MPLNLVQSSIIVIASDHNPSVLNPDFLTLRNIIQSDWNWSLIQPPIVTPPYAQVRYDSGVSITVELNKLRLIDETERDDPNDSRIPEIAKKYVRTLEHVRYTSVGTNFRSYVDHDTPWDALSSQFLQERLYAPNTPIEGLVKYTYKSNDARVTLSIETAIKTVQPESSSHFTKGFLLNCNFHRACRTDYPSVKEVVQFIDNFSNDWQTYYDLSTRLIELAQIELAQ